MALPLVGALAATVASQSTRLRSIAWVFPVVCASLTLIAAWIALDTPFEVTIGNWVPVSMTGSPLIMAGSRPGATFIIAIAAVQWLTSLQPSEQGSRTHHTAAALVFSVAVMTAFANNFLTLIVGMGLVDLLSIVTGLLRGRDSRQAITDGLFCGAATALFTVAIVLYAASNNSLYLPLAHIPDRLMVFITIGLALQLGLIPLRSTAGHFHDRHWTTLASAIVGLIVLEKLTAVGSPEHRAWFFGLAVLTAIVTLAIGAISQRRSYLSAGLSAGLMSLAAVSALLNQPGLVATSAMAWLLGAALLAQPASSGPSWARFTNQAGRAIGALCAAGVPITVGFIGRSGEVSIWAARGINGAVLIAGYSAAIGLLTLCSLKLVRLRGDGPPLDQPPILGALTAIATGVLAAHIVLFGVAPELSGAPSFTDAVTRNGPAGWLTWLAAILLGALAWWLEPRWIHWVAPARQRLYGILNLSWLHSVLDGAMLRIGAPLSRVFSVLESGSALLWTVIILLIIALVSRPGGP